MCLPYPHVKIWGVENQHANFFSPFPFLSFPPRLPDRRKWGIQQEADTPGGTPKTCFPPPSRDRVCFPASANPRSYFSPFPKIQLGFCYGRRGAREDRPRGKRAPCNLAHSPERLRAPPLFLFLFLFCFQGYFTAQTLQKPAGGCRGEGGNVCILLSITPQPGAGTHGVVPGAGGPPRLPPCANAASRGAPGARRSPFPPPGRDSAAGKR